MTPSEVFQLQEDLEHAVEEVALENRQEAEDSYLEALSRPVLKDQSTLSPQFGKTENHPKYTSCSATANCDMT